MMEVKISSRQLGGLKASKKTSWFAMPNLPTDKTVERFSPHSLCNKTLFLWFFFAIRPYSRVWELSDFFFGAACCFSVLVDLKREMEIDCKKPLEILSFSLYVRDAPVHNSLRDQQQRPFVMQITHPTYYGINTSSTSLWKTLLGLLPRM